MSRRSGTVQLAPRILSGLLLCASWCTFCREGSVVQYVETLGFKVPVAAAYVVTSDVRCQIEGRSCLSLCGGCACEECAHTICHNFEAERHEKISEEKEPSSEMLTIKSTHDTELLLYCGPGHVAEEHPITKRDLRVCRSSRRVAVRMENLYAYEICLPYRVVHVWHSLLWRDYYISFLRVDVVHL